MKKRLLPALLAVLLLAALLTGCGASSAPQAANSKAAASYDTAGSGGYGYTAASESSMYAETPMEPMPETEMAYDDGWDMQQTTSNPALKNAKLIYTADIGLETTEFDDAVSRLTELVSRLGGYFEASNIDSYGTYRSGYYTVRVPAESFNELCTQASGLCQLNYINRSAQDISESYYDTESRLTTQQTKLARLQELLAQAESMEDIITIESAISDTELQIESLTGTLRRYDSLVGYSTVNITLSEVYRLSDIEEPAIGFGAKLVSAFKQGCRSFVSGLQSLVLGFAYGWVGWLIFIAVVVIVVRLVIRSVRRRRSGEAAPKKRLRPGKKNDAGDETKEDE